MRCTNVSWVISAPPNSGSSSSCWRKRDPTRVDAFRQISVATNKWRNTMIKIIKSDDRYHADHCWLDTRWHFSFGDYYDPANVNWSALRVFNDDVVQAKTGFDMHPHRDMEIVTYVIDGELSHADSVGNRGVIHPGEVQVMSAGKGIL